MVEEVKKIDRIRINYDYAFVCSTWTLECGVELKADHIGLLTYSVRERVHLYI